MNITGKTVACKLSFDNDNYLDSTTGKNWTTVGSHVSITSDSHSGSGSLIFDSGSVTDNSAITGESVPLLNNNYEISFYAKNLAANLNGTDGGIIYSNDNQAVYGHPYNMNLEIYNGDKFYIWNENTVRWGCDDVSVSEITKNKWINFKVTRVMDTQSIYIDNVLRNTLTMPTNATYNQFGKISTIGSLYYFSGYNITGQIDDFEIILYPRGTVNSTPILLKQY